MFIILPYNVCAIVQKSNPVRASWYLKIWKINENNPIKNRKRNSSKRKGIVHFKRNRKSKTSSNSVLSIAKFLFECTSGQSLVWSQSLNLFCLLLLLAANTGPKISTICFFGFWSVTGMIFSVRRTSRAIRFTRS